MGFGDNFHIINGVAFTEDDVVVYNIFACNIPKKISKRIILQYFEEFGRVTSARILFSTKNKEFNQAFVKFYSAQDAAKVLQCGNHVLGKSQLRVLACNSWHQPGSKQDMNECVSHEKVPLLRLNDDCLLVIFKYLYLEDQVSLSRCHIRLREIFILHATKEYKNLSFDVIENLTLWQSRLFFEMIGHKIKCLRGRVPSKQIINFIGNYCTSVEKIKVHNEFVYTGNWAFSSDSLGSLLKHMCNVKELYLVDVFLKDDCIPHIQKLPNLKCLSLDMNYDLTGRHLKNLVSLEKLLLNNCLGIQSLFFKEMSENLKEVKVLGIQNCSLLKTSDLAEMVKYYPNLETLQLSCDNVEVECIAELPKLKKLTLFAKGLMSTRILSALVQRLENQLELLELQATDVLNLQSISHIAKLKMLKVLICPRNRGIDDQCLETLSNLKSLTDLSLRKCTSFTDDGLINFICKCPKLSSLNLTGCRQLSSKCFEKLLINPECNENNNDRQLKITVSFLRFNHFTGRTYDAKSVEKKPKLIFEYSWT